MTIYIFIRKKLNPYIYLLLIGAVLVTVSRLAYVGLSIMLMLNLLLRRTKRNIIIISAVCFTVIIVFVFSTLIPDVDLMGRQDNAISYREFARQKGMYIWEDHPIVGAGPGMFGGVVSKIFVSPIYKEYRFPFHYIQSIGGIDQFWPQVFAEIGIVGFVLFVALILATIKTLLFMKEHTVNDDIKNLSTGSLVFLMVIYVYTFGTGFNTTAVIFTYFAFIGIAIGSMTNKERGDI